MRFSEPPTMPASWDAPNSRPKESTAFEHDGRAERDTILLAEDDYAFRELTRRTLEARGFVVLAAASGEEAVRLFDRHRDRIRLLVLDTVLPDLSGPRIFEYAQALEPDLPVVYVSGYSSRTLSRFLPEPLEPLLQKPFRMERLVRTMREMLDPSPPLDPSRDEP